MNTLLVGNGKMAKAVARECKKASITCFTDIAKFQAHPQENTVAIHFGSGRQMEELAECCEDRGIPLIQGSTKFKTADYSRPGLLMIDAPNTSLQIVYTMMVVPDMIEALSKKLGMKFRITETHQASKKDKSGTARRILDTAELPHSLIRSVRDRTKQVCEYGVPQKFLNGHAYHYFTFTGPGGLKIEVTTKVHGRRTYALGAITLAEGLSDLRLGAGTYQLTQIIQSLID